MKLWLVTWNGKITRDRGTKYVLAHTMIEAATKFEGAYPTRRAEKVDFVENCLA